MMNQTATVMFPPAVLPMAELLTPEEVAERLKISRRTVYRWLHADEIPEAVKFGAQWRIPAHALDRMGKRPTPSPDSGEKKN